MWHMVAFGLMLVGSTQVAPPNDDGSAAAMRKMYKELGAPGLEGAALQKAIRKADSSPLGSEQNPVRVNMPAGERDYLRRLRCSDGAAPVFDRNGSVGAGPYGYILDLYSVTCPGKESAEVYMDMYHDQIENRPVPGFTVNAN